MRSSMSHRCCAFVGAALVVALLLPGVTPATGRASEPAAPATRRLPPEEMRAGDVTIKVTPKQVTDRRAVFRISIDTHSTDLDIDVATAARLRVGGVEWPGARYAGDGPGGHHREGVVRFRAASAPYGAMRLTINAFGDSVTARWNLEKGGSDVDTG